MIAVIPARFLEGTEISAAKDAARSVSPDFKIIQIPGNFWLWNPESRTRNPESNQMESRIQFAENLHLKDKR